LGKTTITNFALKTDVKNKDSLNLIVSDVKGYFYIYNINKNSLINQFRIHDTGILNFKISTNKTNSFNSNSTNEKNTQKTLIYSIDTSGVLKIFELNSGEELKSAKISKEGKGNILFDIDEEEKFLVFSKNTKIKLLSLEALGKKSQIYNQSQQNSNFNIKSLIVKIGMHSQEITNLKFSSDSRFILSSTKRDYIVSVWHLKNKETPLFTFQNQIFPLENYMLKINKGTYHAISLNRDMINIFKINLKEIDPNEPIKPLFVAKFPQKNLLKINIEDILYGKNKDFIDYNILENIKNSDKIIQAIYGNLIKCEIKSINYSSKGNKDDIQEKEISIKLKEDNINQENKNKNKNVIVNSNNLKILNEIEMNNLEEYKEKEIKDNDNKNENEINKKLGILVENYNNNDNANNNLTNKDTKISLLNIIRNSLINNDFNQFEWALDQKVILLFNNLLIFFY
jgi:hypothetical protein